MNSSNDPLDNLLRQRFQQSFDGHEVVPDESLKKQIWVRLPRAAQRRYWPYGALLGMLISSGAGLYYWTGRPVASPKRINAAPVLLHKHALDKPITMAQASEDSLDRQMATVALSPTKIANPVSVPAGLRGQQGTHVNPSIVPQRREPLSAQLDPSQPNAVVLAGVIAKKVPRPYHKQLKRLVEGDKTNSVTALSVQRYGITSPDMWASGSTVLRRKIATSPQVVTNESFTSLSTSPRLPLPTIQPLGWPRATGFSATLSRRVSFLSPAVFPEGAGSQPVPRAPVQWFIGGAPLSTYQRITVVAKTDTYVQHVGLPSLWSGQTWGYQLRGGIRWHQWEGFLSYGLLRRWAYYDLATDEYQIEANGGQGYQVTRLVQAVTDNVSLPLLGASLSKQYRLKSHPQVYGRIGGQVTYTPTTRQAQSWVQASVGLTVALGSAFQGQVGPTVEYGLNRLWSTDRQLRIHPYLIGASLTLYPKNFIHPKRPLTHDATH